MCVCGAAHGKKSMGGADLNPTRGQASGSHIACVSLQKESLELAVQSGEAPDTHRGTGFSYFTSTAHHRPHGVAASCVRSLTLFFFY